jgi:phosphatidylethanolamine-binding protein (PEBP) family uncharacterized protein
MPPVRWALAHRALARGLPPTICALTVSISLASCGGGGGGSSSSSQTTPLVVPGNKPAASVQAVAYVSGTPIAKASYEHWLRVENAMGGTVNADHRALGFLITSSWVVGEAAARHLSVSEEDVSKRLAQVEKQSFTKPGALNEFLARSHQTEADLRARVRLELLQNEITGQVTSSVSSARRKARLTAFERNFQAHWRRVTDCLPAYVMEDCKQYKGGREANLLNAPSPSASASRGSSREAARPAPAGEVYTPPGAFSVTSPAFERNAPVPSQYTCDGKGVSPPLQWANVPKGAAALVLFVIDDSSARSNGGIRWVVGDIDPSSSGVAAGKVPAGGIVGTNTAGQAAYGPICPDKGKTDTIEIVMYALKRRIALTPGFQPSTAESEYGPTKDLLGQAAVTYAVYHRA